MSTAEPIIVTRDLTKQYDAQLVLKGINLDIQPGVIVGLIGPSGCGKTTLVRTMAGIVTPTSGTVTVFGGNPAQFGTEEHGRFGYMPQLPVLFPNLTVWGNLTFVASVYATPWRHRKRRLMELLDLVGLAGDRRKLLSQLSGGMQRRLALAATLVHDPELLYLDEPTAGVDPILRERFWGHFRALRDQGKTVIVPTQYVGEAVSCDQVAVMSAGELVTVQPPDQLARFAWGGDPFTVTLDRGWISAAEVQRITSNDFVRSVRHSGDDLIVAVADGQSDGPRLQTALQQLIPTATVEPRVPDYDEIFFAIIERHRAELAAAAKQASSALPPPTPIAAA